MDSESKTEVININKLQVGDTLVNIGEVLEIEEREISYFFVIKRMDERQVWKFSKAERLSILSGRLERD
jgi:hypothetical protein